LEACDKYADKYKHEKYDNGFINTQILFVPVIFSTFGSLNQEGYEFIKDLFRRNCDSLGQERCTYMPLLWQKLSISLQKENFKMMSRRFNLSNDLSKLRTSTTTDGIPEISNLEIDKSTNITIQNQNYFEQFLKERMEESDRIFNNLAKTPQENDTNEIEEETNLKEDLVISEYIKEEVPLNLAIEEESNENQIINK